MFRLASPEYLYFLLVIPLLLLLYVWSHWKMKKRIHRLGDLRVLRALIPDYSPRRFLIKASLWCLSVILLVLVMARPQFGTRQGTTRTEGLEVVVMLDVSNSMLATDIVPNRLQRSKMMLSTLVGNLKNDKVALGVFAGEAYPQLPLTNDMVSAKMFIDTFSPDMVTYQGTNSGAAIRLALKSFSKDTKTGKVIVLITDGENHEDGAIEAAQEVKKEGVRLVVIGVGSAAGALIPTVGGGVLKDESGQPVRTCLNEDMCKEIAQESGGLYLHLDETTYAQEQLMADLDKIQKSENTMVFTEENEQFQALAILAFLVLLLELFVFEKKSFLTKRIRSLFVWCLFIVISVSPGFAQTPLWTEMNKGKHHFENDRFELAEKHFGNALSMDSTNAKIHLNMGNTLLALGNADSALYHYQHVADLTSDKFLKADAYHNAGVIYQSLAGHAEREDLKQDLLKRAIGQYTNALRLVPTADDSRYNLVLSLKQLKDSQQQSQNQNQDQNREQEEEKEKQDSSSQSPPPSPQSPPQSQPEQRKPQTEQLLNYSRNMEQKTKEKIQVRPVRRYKQKNW